MKIPPKGVADNKTYKDQYHFSNRFSPRATKDDLPSLNLDPDINSTIKENPDKSNVEIEGGELVLQPDMSALFKAKGKKHSGGGMDVYLKPNSFVFSNDKTLSFSAADLELFEFKKGGKMGSPETYTPAKVVQKNVNPEHYNTLINNITDVNKDELAKKSSIRMLQKYISTLGNVAFLQEQKKHFPQGLPEISQGTAPVYNTELKNEVEAQKQYKKFGGEVEQKFLPGGMVDWCPCGRNEDGSCVEPCAPSVYESKLPAARQVGAALPGYKHLYDNIQYSLHGKYGDYKPGQKATKFMSNPEWIEYLKNEKPMRKAARLAGQKATEGPDDYIKVPKTGPPNAYTLPNFGGYGSPEPPVDNLPTPNTVGDGVQAGKRADWQFTPWQKISQLYNWGQYAGVKRYMPYRSHFNATYAEPSLLNPEQAIGDVQAAANQQISALNTLSPILRNAQAQSIYGQVLDKTPQIRSQYDNQNAQITNQFRGINNQIKNQETMTNIGLDQQYHVQSVEGRKNFDNLKTFTANNAMNNVLGDVESNQTLAYKLLQQENPAYGYDFRTGTLTRNQKDIRDVYSSSQGDYMQGLLKDIDFKSLSNTEKIQYIRELQRGKALQYLPQAFGTTPPPYKMGGKFRGNNRKY